MTTLTRRDEQVLRALARWRAAPLRAVLRFFPTREAGYVRLGTLVRAGMIARATHHGERIITLTNTGAQAVGARLPRSPMSSRRLDMIRLDGLMAKRSYAPIAPPPGAPIQPLYYANGESTAVAAVYCADGSARRIHRLASRLGRAFLSGQVGALLVFAPPSVRMDLRPLPWGQYVAVVRMPEESRENR